MMAGKIKLYQKRFRSSERRVLSNFITRKGSQPIRKAMLEEAVQKIVGRSSGSRILRSTRKSKYGTEDLLSPDDPTPDNTLRGRHNEGDAWRPAPTLLKTRHKKRIAEFSGIRTNREATEGKRVPKEKNISPEYPAKEYTEYVVEVTSHWDKEFVQKFTTRNYLKERQCQLQEIYCKRKLLASIGRRKLLDMSVETSPAQCDEPVSSEPLIIGRCAGSSNMGGGKTTQEQVSWSPVPNDSPSLLFSPPIPPATPILDPLQYLRKVFPKAQEESSSLLLPANQHSEGGYRQQIQHCHASSTVTSVEPCPTLSPVVLDPGEADETYRASSLYVPLTFSLSMDTADINFKYYPHTF